MVKKITFFIFIFSFLMLGAQVTNEGQPLSWDLVETKTEQPIIRLDRIDIASLRKQDQVNDLLPAKPWRFGVVRSLNYGLDNGGYWTELDNGDRIWRIQFESPEAVNISFNFGKFYLPEGAHLYLYSDDRSELLGAYTNQVNNKHKMLGSGFIKSDKVWLEYYEPLSVKGEGELSIESLVHGYRMGQSYQKGYLSAAQQKALNDSGNCNHDVQFM